MRESRLFGSTWGYIRRNAGTITRVFAAYEPIRFFGAVALLLLAASALGFTPFLYDWLVNGDRSGHLQSIVVASVLFVGALQVGVLAILADMMRNQRVVSQRTLERLRGVEIELGVDPQHYVGAPNPTVVDKAAERAPTSLAEALDVAWPDLDASEAGGNGA